MPIEHDGKQYHAVMGSDEDRDGMYIEVREDKRELIEVFYSDVSHQMSVTLFEQNVPVEVVEWAISVARTRLPVSAKPGS